MASVRQLKKDINYLTYDLVNECFVYQCFHPDVENERVENIVKDILEKRNSLIKRINAPEKFENKNECKKFYRSIEEDAAKLVDVMSELE